MTVLVYLHVAWYPCKTNRVAKSEPLCRQVLLLYELLEGRADPYLEWPSHTEGALTVDRVNAKAALQALIADQDWAKAIRYEQLAMISTFSSSAEDAHHLRSWMSAQTLVDPALLVCRWADVTTQPQHDITLAHASALLADWQRLMWLPGHRQHAWDDIQQLFCARQLPPLVAAHFLISAAERLGSKGLLEVDEQGSLIKVTHSHSPTLRRGKRTATTSACCAHIYVS